MLGTCRCVSARVCWGRADVCLRAYARIHSCCSSTTFKVYKDKAFSQELRLLAELHYIPQLFLLRKPPQALFLLQRRKPQQRHLQKHPKSEGKGQSTKRRPPHFFASTACPSCMALHCCCRHSKHALTPFAARPHCAPIPIAFVAHPCLLLLLCNPAACFCSTLLRLN